MSNNEIIKECMLKVKEYVIKNNYHLDYPNEIIPVLINKNSETKEEHEQFIKELKEEGITIIYNNALEIGYYITAIDNIIFKLEKANEHKQELIDLSNENLKLYNIDKIDNKEIMKNTKNLKYWFKEKGEN